MFRAVIFVVVCWASYCFSLYLIFTDLVFFLFPKSQIINPQKHFSFMILASFYLPTIHQLSDQIDPLGLRTGCRISICLFSGAGDGSQCSLLLSAYEDWGPRRWLACLAAGGLDGGVLTCAVHELTGVLQHCGAGCSSPGMLSAPGLPPQWIPYTGHGPSVA